MKRTVLFVVAFMLATTGLKAQSFNLLDHHNMGGYYVGFENLTEMHDGQLMANVVLSNSAGQGDYGYCHLKVSRDDAQVLDSIIVEDNNIEYRSLLFEPNRHGDDYVFVRFVRDATHGDSLRISRYDESFAPVSADVSIPLDETVSYQTRFCQGNNDFIVAYGAVGLGGMVFSRYGFDGELKNKVFYHDSVCPISKFMDGRLKVWNEAGTEYLLCGTGQGRFAYWILDSTLNVIDSATFKAYEGQGSLQFFSNKDNDVVNVDNETYLVATHYTAYYDGITVLKRDKATHENVKRLNFKQEHPIGQWIVGMDRSSDGAFYLAFWEEYLKVVKFDEDLNILWECVYDDMPNTGTCYSNKMKTLTHGGLAIGGFQASGGINNEVFVLVINDENTSASVKEAEFRPYTCWPNPAQDQLHLQFSPEAQPKQIELYDLQGRLVSKQTKGLESLNMADLPAGAYMMRVVLEDGKTYSDKVVKE